MKSTIKIIDDKIEVLQRDVESYRWSNSQDEKWCKYIIKLLKKIRKELMRELKNQKILKL